MQAPFLTMTELVLIVVAAILMLCAALDRAHVAHSASNVIRNPCLRVQVTQKNGVLRAPLRACPWMEVL